MPDWKRYHVRLNPPHYGILTRAYPGRYKGIAKIGLNS